MNPEEFVQAFGKRTAFVILGLIAAFAVLNATSSIVANVWIERQKLNTEKALETNRVAVNKTIEQDKKYLEVTKLLFDKYQGKKAAEQTQTLNILLTLYPEHIKRIQKLLVKQAASPQVKRRAEGADAVAAIISKSGGQPKPDAATAERAGFESIVHGDLSKARLNFERAYGASPTYHNVDEIYHQVLTNDRIKLYSSASAQQRRAILRKVAQEIRKNYSWGLPADLIEPLRQLAG